MLEQVSELSLSRVLEPDSAANPYIIYRELRSRDPVHWDEPLQRWVLTRYTDVVAVLRSPAFGTAEDRWYADSACSEVPEEWWPTVTETSRQMVFRDPPDHTRLRALVNKAFTPRVVESMNAHIEHIVDRLLDGVEAAKPMEVIRDLARPLPLIVITDMLGVRPADRIQVARWSAGYAALIDGVPLSREAWISAAQGVSRLGDYFRGMVAEHRSSPRDNLLQALITAEDHDDALTEEELVGNCVLLLGAGFGTTTHLISNGLLALLRHPDQLLQLREGRSLLGSAVTEMLRYDPPIQAIRRVARQVEEVGGVKIGKGQSVLVVLGAANHDPEQFSDPERLNLSRQDNRHVAFAHGIHYCVGAPLARLQTQIALERLLARFPHLELATENLEWKPSLVFRGLKALPIWAGR